MEKSISEVLPEELFNRIHQAVGEASTCWSNLDGAGIFDALRAGNIALDLCIQVSEEIVRVKGDTLYDGLR